MTKQINYSLQRCPWARTEPMIRYHDQDWGEPVHDDQTLFEFLILEGAQAGLSWETILNKRENYRGAFDDFEVKKVARYDGRKIAQLLKNPGIVRNRLKISGSFDNYIWRFVDGRPRINRWRSAVEVPPRTPESDALSKALKQRGFKFVGSTICYAFMQAVGLVNDHVLTCFRCPRR
jgi:DNA-3-methyladenine glycosylase I